MPEWFRRLFGARKSAPAPPPPTSTWAGLPSDGFARRREPSPGELSSALRDSAYACAAINAAACAAHPPRLYSRAGGRVEEVLSHPLLTLLETVNPAHSRHDLFELTALDQEVHGSAYWLLHGGGVWPLPAGLVTPVREGGPLAVAYEYRAGGSVTRFPAAAVVHFRYPDPRDPYGPGLSPLRAAFEQAELGAEFLAFKRALWANAGAPGVILSPGEVLSEPERQRLEAEWNAKFRHGGQGRVLVAEGSMSVHVLERSLGDLATLAEEAFSKEQVANAFGVPVALLTRDTNMANLQAALHQHAVLAVRPRLKRRDEKLNERLVPLYDGSGELFFRSDDPLAADPELELRREEQELRRGVRTINEARAARGLAPVPWGGVPWLPLADAPTDFARRPDYGPGTGRNRDTERGDDT